MNNDSTSLAIGKKAFLTSFLILMVLIIVTGILGKIIPSGAYTRSITAAGQSVLVPGSFTYADKGQYPIWRWFTAPVEILAAHGNIMIITIIVFLLIVAGSVSIMMKSGALNYAIEKLLVLFGSRRFLLVRLLILVFMLFGSFLGIFEETVLFIPLITGLAMSMHWDKKAGLALSLGAVGMGFSAAVTNPFTIGVAQKLAGLPLLDGAWLRLLAFALIYALYQWYVVRYLKKLEAKKLAVTSDDYIRTNQKQGDAVNKSEALQHGKALRFLVSCIALMTALIVLAPLIPLLSEFSFPLIAIIFLIAGIGTGSIARLSFRESSRTFLKGAGDVAPGIVLVLLAASIKHIMTTSGILDTILHEAATRMEASPPFITVLLIYLIVMVLNFFISSGSAKAFLIIPIVIPIADLAGLPRNMAVLAYIFGDGFSNILYPSNALLLIALSIAGLDYKSWFRWILPLQILVLILTSLILLGGTIIRL